ncbi:cyclic GMP-AMP synthase-like receptor 1 isoform X1 [Ptychodera flava]|uniref:cyclic GMP-AMP synthase-like receptor 1 isoform X1 n=1 Tax=Ptychodera flava TaxID=63121 RepID=UPI00396A3EBE
MNMTLWTSTPLLYPNGWQPSLLSLLYPNGWQPSLLPLLYPNGWQPSLLSLLYPNGWQPSLLSENTGVVRQNFSSQNIHSSRHHSHYPYMTTLACSSLESTDLNRFYDQKVQLKGNEMTETLQEILPILRNIMDYVSKRDPRFTNELIPSGSYYEGLKVSKPDEFDFMVPLNIKKPYHVNGQHIDHPPRGYCFLDKPVGDVWDESYLIPLDDAGRLTPWRVKQEFQRLVGEATEALGLQSTVLFADPPTHGPAITIVIKTWNRVVYVDLAPAAIPERGAGLPSCIPWPHGGAWWPSYMQEKVRNISCYFVPKKDYYWHMSTAAMERALLSDVDEDGGCRKKCLCILKKLREDFLCPDGDGINSYHLKTAFLWELEKNPDPEYWRPSNIVQCFTGLFKRVQRNVEEGSCPHFFIVGEDLLERTDRDKLDEVSEKMNRFLKNPKRYLSV